MYSNGNSNKNGFPVIQCRYVFILVFLVAKYSTPILLRLVNVHKTGVEVLHTNSSETQALVGS